MDTPSPNSETPGRTIDQMELQALANDAIDDAEAEAYYEGLINREIEAYYDGLINRDIDAYYKGLREQARPPR